MADSNEEINKRAYRDEAFSWADEAFSREKVTGIETPRAAATVEEQARGNSWKGRALGVIDGIKSRADALSAVYEYVGPLSLFASAMSAGVDLLHGGDADADSTMATPRLVENLAGTLGFGGGGAVGAARVMGSRTGLNALARGKDLITGAAPTLANGTRATRASELLVNGNGLVNMSSPALARAAALPKYLRRTGESIGSATGMTIFEGFKAETGQEMTGADLGWLWASELVGGQVVGKVADAAAPAFGYIGQSLGRQADRIRAAKLGDQVGASSIATELPPGAAERIQTFPYEVDEKTMTSTIAQPMAVAWATSTYRALAHKRDEAFAQAFEVAASTATGTARALGHHVAARGKSDILNDYVQNTLRDTGSTVSEYTAPLYREVRDTVRQQAQTAGVSLARVNMRPVAESIPDLPAIVQRYRKNQASEADRFIVRTVYGNIEQVEELPTPNPRQVPFDELMNDWQSTFNIRELSPSFGVAVRRRLETYIENVDLHLRRTNPNHDDLLPKFHTANDTNNAWHNVGRAKIVNDMLDLGVEDAINMPHVAKAVLDMAEESPKKLRDLARISGLEVVEGAPGTIKLRRNPAKEAQFNQRVREVVMADVLNRSTVNAMMARTGETAVERFGLSNIKGKALRDELSSPRMQVFKQQFIDGDAQAKEMFELIEHMANFQDARAKMATSLAAESQIVNATMGFFFGPIQIAAGAVGAGAVAAGIASRSTSGDSPGAGIAGATASLGVVASGVAIWMGAPMLLRYLMRPGGAKAMLGLTKAKNALEYNRAATELSRSIVRAGAEMGLEAGQDFGVIPKAPWESANRALMRQDQMTRAVAEAEVRSMNPMGSDPRYGASPFKTMLPPGSPLDSILKRTRPPEIKLDGRG